MTQRRFRALGQPRTVFCGSAEFQLPTTWVNEEDLPPGFKNSLHLASLISNGKAQSTLVVSERALISQEPVVLREEASSQVSAEESEVFLPETAAVLPAEQATSGQSLVVETLGEAATPLPDGFDVKIGSEEVRPTRTPRQITGKADKPAKVLPQS